MPLRKSNLSLSDSAFNQALIANHLLLQSSSILLLDSSVNHDVDSVGGGQKATPDGQHFIKMSGGSKYVVFNLGWSFT